MNTSFKRSVRPFSITLFILTVVTTLALYFFVLKGIAPHVFEQNMAAPFDRLLTVFILASAANAFGEFFFHRYMLHNPFPMLGRLYKQHTLHHGLTQIKLVGLHNETG